MPAKKSKFAPPKAVEALKHEGVKRRNIPSAECQATLAEETKQPVLLNYFQCGNDPDAWASLNSDTSRPFDKPSTGRIAVKVINHLGDVAMKVFGI
ncbi:MAG: hypothetical protein HC901_01220 [Bdellovibrionaceae bacterium]|nr:hypothetical protein [Pseudobdellovibrionaceae bacterium]